MWIWVYSGPEKRTVLAESWHVDPNEEISGVVG
jgi:hypothetical protein